MKLEEALFNWLQIQIVADARPHDRSAQETASFFRQILLEDHQVRELTYQRQQDWYVLTGQADEGNWERRYPAETAEALLTALQSDPRYDL